MGAGLRGCGAGTFGPTARGAGRGCVGGLLRPIHHPEHSEQGGYHRVRGSSARRSYPLHFRLSRARPRWLPEGSIHHGGKEGGYAGVGGALWRCGEGGVAGTRSTNGHPEKHGGGGLGPLVHVEEGTCSLPWRGTRAGAGFGPSLRHPAGCWGADPWVPGLAHAGEQHGEGSVSLLQPWGGGC